MFPGYADMRNVEETICVACVRACVCGCVCGCVRMRGCRCVCMCLCVSECVYACVRARVVYFREKYFLNNLCTQYTKVICRNQHTRTVPMCQV